MPAGYRGVNARISSRPAPPRFTTTPIIAPTPTPTSTTADALATLAAELIFHSNYASVDVSWGMLGDV